MGSRNSQIEPEVGMYKIEYRRTDGEFMCEKYHGTRARLPVWWFSGDTEAYGDRAIEESSGVPCQFWTRQNKQPKPEDHPEDPNIFDEFRTMLYAGDLLPDFRLQAHNGEWITAQNFVGRRTIFVLYDKGDNFMMRQRCRTYGQYVDVLEREDVTVVFITADSVLENKRQKWAERMDSPHFVFLSDPKREWLRSADVVKAEGGAVGFRGGVRNVVPTTILTNEDLVMEWVRFNGPTYNCGDVAMAAAAELDWVQFPVKQPEEEEEIKQATTFSLEVEKKKAGGIGSTA